MHPGQNWVFKFLKNYEEVSFDFEHDQYCVKQISRTKQQNTI